MSKAKEQKNPLSISHERYEEIMNKDPGGIKFYGPLKFYPVDEIAQALRKIRETYSIAKIDVWFNSTLPSQFNGSTYRVKESKSEK